MRDTVTVRLRRNADGAVREFVEKWWSGDGGDYIWSEGNYACDCNRFLFFERAGGREPGDDEGECNVGPNAYTVLSITNASGAIVYSEVRDA